MREGERMVAGRRAEIVRDAATVIGLSILLPYFRSYFLSPVNTSNIHSATALEGAYLAYVIAFALSAIAVIFQGQRVMRLMCQRRAQLAAGAVGSAGLLLLWLPSSQGLGTVAETALCVAGTVANVAFFIASLLGYISSLERLDTGRCVAVASVGFGLSFANNLFDLLPTGAAAVVCVVSPLVCALCAPASSAADSPESAAEGASAKAPLFFGAAPVAFFILLSLFCLTGNFVRGATNPWFSIGRATISSLYMTLINFALVALTLVLLARRVAVNKVVFFNWIAYMLLFFAGILIMVIMPTESAAAGSNLTTTSRVGFTLLMLLFVLSPQGWTSMGLAQRTGLFLLVPEAIAAIVRYTIVPAYLASANAEPGALLTYGAAIIIFVLSAAIVFMLGSLLLRTTEPAPAVASTRTTAGAPAVESPRPRSKDEVVAQLAQRYSLTPREADVVRYAGQGFSLEKTAQLLGVSINTVRTHARSIYVKLDIHNRQELIELVQAASDQDAQ